MKEPFVLARAVVANAERPALEKLLIERTGSHAAARWVMSRLDRLGSPPEIDNYLVSEAIDAVHGARLPPEVWSVTAVSRVNMRARPQDTPCKDQGDALLHA